MIGGVIDAHGRLDILVNNAGTHKPHTIDSLTEEQWDGFISLNLKSQFLCIKAAVPHLRQTRGSIINMSSMTGVVGQPDALAYCATKGGILAMTKALAMDLAEDGVRVNAVCPAAVRTPLMEQWIGQQDDPDAVRELMNTMQPLGEMAEPEQIGDVVLFLASEASSFITGIHLPVDGGATLGY
jgi:NAD(P)-dependent dehydrogenase (short-subunit alcohol dehydrogenase family)